MIIQTHSGAQLGRRGETSPALFENRKKPPGFRKKGTDCIHLWVKFSIQNVVLRVSTRKKLQNVSLWGLFFGVFDEILIQVP